MYISSLLSLCPPASHSSRSSQITQLNSLCYSAASNYLPFSHMLGYISEKVMTIHPSILAWRIPGMGAWWSAIYGVTQSRTQLMWQQQQQCIYVNATQFAPLTPSPFVSTSPCSMSVSIPTLKISSSALFFYISYICINIWYLFFSFWFISLCLTESIYLFSILHKLLECRYFLYCYLFYPILLFCPL